MAKRFFYVCAGILCLALAYHLGATSATAQSPTSKGLITEIATNGPTLWVVTANDEIYAISGDSAPSVSKGTGWAKYSLGVLR